MTPETVQIVHGIDRRSQEHLCGIRAGLGTDARQPSMAITCVVCIDRLCIHCKTQVEPDGSGDWIHTRGLYRCQSPAVAYGHLAHPPSVPCRAGGPNPCLGALSTPPAECDNYRSPVTCLTAPSSEAARCDKCRARLNAEEA